MTYCAGLCLRDGLVLASDTRTNAGVDNVATFKKMHVWERPGDRVVTLLSAGNLAASQSVVSLLDERAEERESGASILSVGSMFQAARLVGDVVRETRQHDGSALEANSEDFQVSFLLGGQIGNGQTRLYQIYTAGNFIETSEETPFFQIGEHKYGKPILDRVARRDMPLGDAAKLMLLSFDSTLRSNLSVGMPIDLLIYRRDALEVEFQHRVEIDDPYFIEISTSWSKALRDVFASLPDLELKP